MLRKAMRAGGLAGLCLAAGVAATGERVGRLDENAFRAVNRGHGTAADRVASGITELGSIWASMGAAAALAAMGHRKVAAQGLATACAAWFAGQGLKKLFLRPRPFEADPEGVRLLAHPPPATSWPSSHPAVVLAFTTMAGRGLNLPTGGRAALDGLAAAVALSRTYVGVHYPSDVVGGLLLGRAVADALSGGAG